MIDKLIEEEKYEQALKLLEGKKDEQSLYYRVGCLQGLKRFDEALIASEEALSKSEKMYYEIKTSQLAILMELGDTSRVMSELEEELSVPFIPSPYEDFFQNLYDALLKQKVCEEKPISMYDSLNDEELEELLLSCDDNEQLLIMSSGIPNRNARKFLDVFKQILLKPSIKRMVKVFLIEILLSQEVKTELTLISEKETITFNTADCSPVFDQPNIEKLDDLIIGFIGVQDITLAQSCAEILRAYTANIFPTLLTVSDSLAAAIISYCCGLMSIDDYPDEEICRHFNIDEAELETASEDLFEVLSR